MKDAKVIGVYGGRGQGKSTWVKNHLRHCDRVIVFDPIYEYADISGFTQVSSINDLRKITGSSLKFRVCFTPPHGIDPADCLSDLCNDLFDQRQKYKDGTISSSRIWVLVVEEMTLCATSEKAKKGYRGFQDIVNKGRHWGIEVIGASQRIKGVSTDYRNSSSTEIFFALHDHDAAKVAEAKFPPEQRGKITKLKPHHYLMREVGADGEIFSEGRNRLAR